MGDIHACIQKSKSQITHCHGFRVEYVYSEGICLGYEAQAWKCSGENSDEMGHGWSLFHVDVCCLFILTVFVVGKILLYCTSMYLF